MISKEDLLKMHLKPVPPSLEETSANFLKNLEYHVLEKAKQGISSFVLYHPYHFQQEVVNIAVKKLTDLGYEAKAIGNDGIYVSWYK